MHSIDPSYPQFFTIIGQNWPLKLILLISNEAPVKILSNVTRWYRYAFLGTSFVFKERKITDTSEPRIILVDTNCFLRLYSLPKLPFWGAIGGYQLLTLPPLLNEFFTGNRLNNDYAWLEGKLRAEDRGKITLTLGGGLLAEMRRECDSHRQYVDDFLYDYCTERKINIRQLSDNDLELLGTASVLRAVIATDEWPLKIIVEDLTRNSDEDDYGIEVFTSVHMLKLLEEGGFITAEQRRETMKSWLRAGERLHRDWDRNYKQLFDEAAPRAS